MGGSILIAHTPTVTTTRRLILNPVTEVQRHLYTLQNNYHVQLYRELVEEYAYYDENVVIKRKQLLCACTLSGLKKLDTSCTSRARKTTTQQL